MAKLFFDTETSADKAQRLVQLAAILTDDDGREIQSVNFIIKPEGFVISPEATAIHGIAHDHANNFGIPLEVALRAFINFSFLADSLVAHNISFDIKVMLSELLKIGINSFTQVERFCTMNSSTNICKIPHASRGGYKWPKLQEAYKHAFGEEFDGAHNALNDVRACMRLYFWLKNHESLGD